MPARPADPVTVPEDAPRAPRALRASAPSPAPPAPGSAHLEVGCVHGISHVASLRSTSPLRLLAPVARGPSVWTYASSFGGGLVGGDVTRLDLHLAPGARAFFGSQSATKVYRNPARHPCGHDTRATLGPDSLLAFIPDPVQPFAEARFRQSQDFSLAPSASLALLDAVTSGRPARDERWAFHHYQSRTRIRVDGEIRFLDLLRLDPEDGRLDAPHRLGRFNCLATLVLLGPLLREPAARLLEAAAARPVRRQAPLALGASPLPDGALVRVAGIRTEEVLHETRRLLDFLPPLLGDDPWARHW